MGQEKIFPVRGLEAASSILLQGGKHATYRRFNRLLGCIALSLLSPPAGLGATAGPLGEADALLAGPTLSMSQATRALSLYEGLLSMGGAPRTSLLARLAHTCFVLGQFASNQQSMGYYEKGQSYAETLIREEPNRVEGHYWLALNLCGQADRAANSWGGSSCPVSWMSSNAPSPWMRPTTRPEHRVLGRIYYEAPGWPLSVGDMPEIPPAPESRGAFVPGQQHQPPVPGPDPLTPSG